MGTDDELDVEAVDTEYAEEEIELRIRGMRGAAVQLLIVLAHGVEAIGSSPFAHRGQIAAASIGAGVVEQLDGEFDMEEIPTGMIEMDEEELAEVLDVDVDVVQEGE